MTKFTNIHNDEPHDKCMCSVLLLMENGDLEEEPAFFHKEMGAFVLMTSDKKPCGTKGRVVYWKKAI